MPIFQSDLRQAGQFRSKSSYFFRRPGQTSAFLSHSHKDAQLALGLQALLIAQGWDVYIDWQDPEMPEKPDSETANNIKNAIIKSEWFLFLATKNSTASRWCPWEIGFADGKKSHDRIAIVPTKDSQGHFYGNEYLNLYKHIDVAPGSHNLALYDTYGNGKWVSNI